ncbi:aminoacrylate peracid reductase [Anaerolineae bacterium]|nr:aminoacrylate peracid reductase [Anaerolineae bacterium]
MTARRVFHTDNAPKAIGPYSQAILSNGFMFCSGQIPIDPKTGEVVTGDIAVQTRQALTNVRALLEDAGTNLANVVKVTVFLHQMSDFASMNAVYGEFFPDAPPARTTVGNLDLPRGVLIEIEVIAVMP